MNEQQLFSIGGIVLVLIGSWFVAYEVVNRFSGYAFRVEDVLCDGSGKVEKTALFQSWEAWRSRWMWVGLLCITLGSGAQIYAVLIPQPVSPQAVSDKAHADQ